MFAPATLPLTVEHMDELLAHILRVSGRSSPFPPEHRHVKIHKELAVSVIRLITAMVLLLDNPSKHFRQRRAKFETNIALSSSFFPPPARGLHTTSWKRIARPTAQGSRRCDWNGSAFANSSSKGDNVPCFSYMPSRTIVHHLFVAASLTRRVWYKTVHRASSSRAVATVAMVL